MTGVVFDGAETYYVHSTTNGSLLAETSAEHFLLSHSELDHAPTRCGYEGTHESHGDHQSHNKEHTSEFNRILRVSFGLILAYSVPFTTLFPFAVQKIIRR